MHFVPLNDSSSKIQNLNVLHSLRVANWHAVKSGVSNGVGCDLFRKSSQSILHITRFPYREIFEVFNQFHKTLFSSYWNDYAE